MTRTSFLLTLCLLLIGCALPICAQQAATDGPSLMKFTGTFAGFDNRPVSGTVGVNFYLYKEKEGGIPLWMETQNLHVDKNGHYSVMLGAATAQGLPAEAFVGDGARWLGVQLEGHPEQTRVFLVSLPYTLKAADAANIAGVPTSASARASSGQGISVGPKTIGGGNFAQTAGMNSPDPRQVQSLLGVKVVAPGATPNLIPVWTGAKVIGESVMTQSGSTIGVAGNVTTTGNVGVGTATPATNLDVFAATAGIHAPMAQFGSAGTTDSNSILTYNGSGRTEMFQSGCAGCFVPGAQAGDGGIRVNKGKNILLGDSGASRLTLDSAGNAEQPRAAGGMVKAMIFFSPNNGGRIVSCFNSTLSGAAATTPPCGFGFDMTGVGDYVFLYNFQVDDRFVSLTGSAPTGTLSICNDIIAVCSNATGHQQLEVSSLSTDNRFQDSKIYLIVY